MLRKLLMIGLDCLGPEILLPSSLADLPNLRRLVNRGLSGTLTSTIPPITVPAWTSMMTGRDPGELGVYGFRNRKSYGYGDLVYATSAMVRHDRLWDHVTKSGAPSIVVGMPQTYPAPTIAGVLVAGFEAQGAESSVTSPPELVAEIERVAEGYMYDIPEFRQQPLNRLRELIHAMTECRLRLMEHLLSSRPWTFAIFCEIGPDRMHHLFWRHHDPSHPRHDPATPYRQAIRDYYKMLDDGVGRLVELAGENAGIIVCSDHGAKAMHGGVCINEVLRDKGWLVLRESPDEQAPLDLKRVDWEQTRAWADGGYYARIYLNIRGREPHGIVDVKDRDLMRTKLAADLEVLELRGGPTLKNQVVWPEAVYRRVRGLAPDLLLFFDDLRWRSLASVGCPLPWMTGNDTGVDEANHAFEGLYIAAGPGIPASRQKPASILDIAPTALRWMQLAVPPDLPGRDLLSQNWSSVDVNRSNRL